MAAAVDTPPSAIPSDMADKPDNLTAEHQFPTDNAPPSEEQLAKCADMEVFDANGKALKFKELYASPGRHLIIFVRHFFCGMCQDYLRAIMASFGPTNVSALPTPTTMTIIGCGQPELINNYAKETGCTFPIYAEPSRKLYDALGLTVSLVMGSARPEYQASSTAVLVAKSFWQGIRAGTNALKGGNFAQLGGEFMFNDGQVTWCHRMAHTRDHVDVQALRDLLGIDKEKK